MAVNRPSPSSREDLPNFSLVSGGPLYQLYLRARILRPPMGLLPRRVAVVVLVSWLPLLLLSAISGTLIGGPIKVPFLYDVEAHVRFLVALPALIAAELVVNIWLRSAVEQFAEGGIVGAADMPKFRAAIAAAMRGRNSVAAEIGLLVFVYVVGHWAWWNQVALGTATWYASPEGAGLALTLAGYWYAFVGIPIFQFILLRWYMRLVLWFWLLWRVARLNLHLIPTHPDRAGGLGFLGESTYAFGPILFAHGALLAGLIANRVLYDGQDLLAFKADAAALVAFFVICIFAPLAMFSPQLMRARRQGLREYGTLATDYVREFGDKWMPRDSPKRKEELLGSADIQSLADLGNSYGFIRDMRPVPFRPEAVLRLAVTTAAPLLPLSLMVIPLAELADRLIKLVL